MRKLTIVFAALALMAFAPEDKKYKVELTMQEAQATINALSQSNAPHYHVSYLEQLIVGQVNAQIAEDARIADSVAKAQADTTQSKPKKK